MGYGCIIRYCNSEFEEKLEVLRELEIRGIEVCFSLFLLSPKEEAYIKEHFRIKVCHMQSPEMRLNIIEKNEVLFMRLCAILLSLVTNELEASFVLTK